MTDQPPDPDHSGLLQATERARLRSLVDADIATTDALHADGSLNYRRFEAVGEEERVRMLGSSGAAVRYRVATDISWEGGEDSGPVWHTDTCELREGRWLAGWSQATRIRTA